MVWQILPSVQEQILTSSRLVIQPNTLKASTNYEFKASVQDGNGFATVQMLTPPVISENCPVNPMEGTEYFTEFTMNCNQKSGIPLVYSIFQGDVQLLSSNNPDFKFKLNAKNGGVRVKIQDSSGQFILEEIKIKITEPTMLNTIDEINEIFTSKNASLDLKRLIADETQSNAIVFINTVAGRLNKLNNTVDVSDTVSQILDLMNELRITYFDDISPVTDVLMQLLQPIQLNHKIATKCARILDKMSIVLQNLNEDVPVVDYVSTTNHILSVINQLIDPFETIPPVQNSKSLISPEYHTEEYESYGELDFGVFEKLANLETITQSVEKTVNALATCAAKSFQPMEMLGNMTANNIQFEVLAFDQEVLRKRGNNLKINGTTTLVTVSEKLQPLFDSDSSISCTFFDKNPMWWFSDGNPINSDVVGVSMYKRGIGVSSNFLL